MQRKGGGRKGEGRRGTGREDLSSSSCATSASDWAASSVMSRAPRAVRCLLPLPLFESEAHTSLSAKVASPRPAVPSLRTYDTPQRRLGCPVAHLLNFMELVNQIPGYAIWTFAGG